MHSLALLIALLSSLTCARSSAEELTISPSARSGLTLGHSNCELLLKTRTAMCEWKKSLNPSFFYTASHSGQCVSTQNHHYEITIEDCLPAFTQKFAGRKTNHNGPNCWGTTMSFHGVSSLPRFVWPEEMLYWLDSPACEKLTPQQELQAGDIINVYSPEYRISDKSLVDQTGPDFWRAVYPGRNSSSSSLPTHGYTGYDGLLHSVTYISPDLAFGKDSPSELDKFYFHPLLQVYGRPRNKESQCQENQTLAPYLREFKNEPNEQRRPTCKYFSNAYRCQNVAQYLKNQKVTTRTKIIEEQVSELQKIQLNLFSHLFSKSRDLEKAQELVWIHFAQTKASNALSDLKYPALSKPEEMLLTLEYFSARGIIKSIQQLHEPKSAP